MENGKWEKHTFAIATYQESKYLEECIQSLKNQTLKSNIIITTSTPNDFVYGLAQKYGLEVKVNDGKKGIGPDWNFAVEQAGTQFVTVAHQDDLYDPHYTEEVQKAFQTNLDGIMVCTNHKEIRNGQVAKKNLNLKIKAIMMLPIMINKRTRLTKRMICWFGNPLSTPSVCVNTDVLGKRPYREDMKSNIDWGSWLDWAEKKGSFIYIKRILTFHRVHSESETSNCIDSNNRIKEDYEMFCRIWPKWFAKFLMIFYKHAQDANKV
ncbi:MAG: glycosyltransferase family 2 protein [Clostridia bacterium]|nr:glycosyltransferase family 2 protein [Clostridia bacterium]